MGKGSRFVLWIKKRLFGKKANAQLKMREGKYVAPKPVPSILEAEQENISESFSDESLSKYLPPGEASGSASSLSQKKCLYETRENQLPFHVSHTDLELGSDEYKNYHTSQGFAPIVEVHPCKPVKLNISKSIEEKNLHRVKQGKKIVMCGKSLKPLATIAEEPADLVATSAVPSVKCVNYKKPMWLVKMEKDLEDALKDDTEQKEKPAKEVNLYTRKKNGEKEKEGAGSGVLFNSYLVAANELEKIVEEVEKIIFLKNDNFASKESKEELVLPVIIRANAESVASDDGLTENIFRYLSNNNQSAVFHVDCLGFPRAKNNVTFQLNEKSDSSDSCEESFKSVDKVTDSCPSNDAESAVTNGVTSSTATETDCDDSSIESSSAASLASDTECASSSDSMEFDFTLAVAGCDDSWDNDNNFIAEFGFCLPSYERGFRACHPSDQYISCDPVEKPKKTVVAEQKLPEKWVDTRNFPRMTDAEVLYDREDLNLFYRKKYFVFKSDRMRDHNYNLKGDHIVPNTEEYRREMQGLLREEEAQAVQEWKEKKLKDEDEAKTKWMVEKLELEKRWLKMNENNRDLWKREQQQNVRKWRVKLMQSEKRWQQLETRWKEEELQFEKMLQSKQDKIQADTTKDDSSIKLAPLQPIPRPPPSNSSSSDESNSWGSSNCRRRLYRRQKQSNSVAVERVQQSTHQVSKTEISSAQTEGYTKMPPIDLSGPGRITGMPYPSAEKSVTVSDDVVGFAPPELKLPPLLNKRGFRKAVDILGTRERELTSFLPPLKNTPITCRPLELNDLPLMSQLPKVPASNYTLPKRSEHYLSSQSSGTDSLSSLTTLTTPQGLGGPKLPVPPKGSGLKWPRLNLPKRSRRPQEP